jgi:hypothetical protein
MHTAVATSLTHRRPTPTRTLGRGRARRSFSLTARTRRENPPSPNGSGIVPMRFLDVGRVREGCGLLRRSGRPFRASSARLCRVAKGMLGHVAARGAIEFLGHAATSMSEIGPARAPERDTMVAGPLHRFCEATSRRAPPGQVPSGDLTDSFSPQRRKSRPPIEWRTPCDRRSALGNER